MGDECLFLAQLQMQLLWHHQSFALVKASVIHLKHVQTIGICFGKLIQKPLIALGIDMRKLQEKGGSGCRFNGTVKPERSEQPLPLPDGFNTTGGDQASEDGFESKTTLILSKVANLSLILSGLAVVLS